MSTFQPPDRSGPPGRSGTADLREVEAVVETDRPMPSARSRIAGQFSLRSLLLGVTLFALVCGLASILPAFISQIVIGAVWIAAAGWLITGIFFARGDQQAFCIGASIVVASMWTGVGARFVEGMTRLLAALSGGWRITEQAALWLDLVLLLLAAIANGWLAVRARRYFER